MKLKGQLEQAQLENLTADPANLPEGRVWVDTTDKKAKVVSNSTVHKIVTEDQALSAGGLVVSASATQTLTNKSIDADTNTITNIDNADIKVGAAIAHSKLANMPAGELLVGSAGNVPTTVSVTGDISIDSIGVTSINTSVIVDDDISASAAIDTDKLLALTASKAIVTGAGGKLAAATTTATEIGYVNGVTSAIQTQLDAKASLTGTQTLTNKTIGDAITLTEIATPSTPAAGLKKLYPKADGKVYTLNSSGIETAVGTGSGGGGINYILNPDAELNTTGWATYADAAGSIPVDGTGGSPVSTLTRVTTTPLRNTACFLWTKGAANRQSEGFSYDFSIDLADSITPKMMQISFDHLVFSGTYDSGSSSANSDLIAYIYNVSDGVLIEPAGMKIQAGMPFKATFQTSYSNSATKQQYRLIIHQSLAGTSAYTMQFDNFSVGPQVTASGYAAYTDRPVTVTGSWTTNSTYTALETRDGGYAIYTVKVALSGAPTSTGLTINLPAGRVIDTARVTSTTSGVAPFGSATMYDFGSAFYTGNVTYSTTTAVNVSAHLASSTYLNNSLVSQTVPFTFGASDTVEVTFRVPILGWESNTVASSETDTRVVTATLNTLSSTTITAGTPLSFTTVEQDSHGAWTSLNSYVVKVPGTYQVSLAGTYITSGTANISVNKNGAAMSPIKYLVTIGSGGRFGGFVNVPNLKAGDVLTLVSDASVTAGATNGVISFTRLSGPAQITASDDVTCRYSTASSQAITTTGTVILYGTKAWDSHGAYNTSTGTFTAPVSGEYAIKNMFFTDAATASVIGGYVATKAVVNGANQGNLAVSIAKTVSPVFQSAGGGGSVMMKAGDTLQIQSDPSGAGTVTLVGAANVNWVEIRRVGNYA